MTLPPLLEAQLESLLHDVHPHELRESAAHLSERYRSGHSTSAPRAATAIDALGYAATRMPATYGAVVQTLSAVHQALPDFAPQSLLDVGSGPGTALWAALAQFPSIADVTALEREPAMRDLGSKLAAFAPDPLRHAQWLDHGLGQAPLKPHDLIIAAYVVGELRPDEAQSQVKALWEAARGVLVVVEPGTPDGFSRIRRLREDLIRAGAQVVAPCPHSQSCPIADGDWCHFAQRIQRTRRHRQLKGADAPFEDEKFSYVAVTRQGVYDRSSRVLRHPQIESGRITLSLCGPDGLTTQVVTRRDPHFKEARKTRWGEVFPPGRK